MKGITSRGLIKYYKYAPTGEIATTPIFPTDISASMGIDGITITPSSYYYLTSLSTHAPARGFTCTFDIGPHKNGIYSIAYNGIVSGGNYPALVLLNVRCSEDGNNWTTIAASYGGRGTTIDTPLVIPTPNNYRYLRFDTTNDDTGYSGSGVNSMRLTYGETDLVPSGRSDHDTYSSTDKKKYIFAKFLREDYYQYWKRNVNPIGNLIFNGSIVSGFNTNNYLIIPELFAIGSSDSFEIVTSFIHKTQSAVGYIVGCSTDATLGIIIDANNVLRVNGGTGSSWYGDVFGTTVLTNNVKYWVKLVRNTNGWYLYLSTDGIEYNLEGSRSWSGAPGNTNIYVGKVYDGLPFLGKSIDLSQSHIKINDKLWWQGVSRSTLAESNFVLPGTSDNYDYKEKVYKKYMPKRNKLKRP